MLGDHAAKMIDIVMNNAEQHRNSGILSTIISVLFILFSGSRAFAYIQKSLNQIWHVDHDNVNVFKDFLYKRLISLLMVFVGGLILLSSFFLSSLLDAIFGFDIWMWPVANEIVSYLLFVVIFALLYGYIPDVDVPWKHIWFGAFITALFFYVGKILIGMFITRTGAASAFGAAGSLVAFLLWVYYSSNVVFFGAELTQAYDEIMRKADSDTSSSA
jgi:membrane protein